MAKKKKLREYNKYWYYEKSVQNAENEVEFFNEKYKEHRHKSPLTLREDFCGTGAISCEWVKQSDKHLAWGIDLDPEPIAYGKEVHLAKLEASAQNRMQYLEANVLSGKSFKTDITFAFNFSYFIFKRRQQLLEYFKVAYESLNKDGIFFVDIFGGPDSIQPNEDIIEHGHFDYHWECQEFNPLTNDCRFAIHFKRDGEKMRKDAFVYDWRMWGVKEVTDAMEEVGFSSVHTYWEADDPDDEESGSGEFYLSDKEEQCDAWVTYIAALK